MVSKPVLDWLLEESQPSVRYRTLTELLGRSETDADVREARKEIPVKGWAASILAERNPAGWWVREWSHFTPEFVSTNWMLLVLSELGVSRDLPEIRDSCELWMRMKPVRYGPIVHPPLKPHLCSLAIGTRALVRFGYGEDPRVRRTLQWIVDAAHPEGGWSHFGGGRNLDSYHSLGALAAVPRARRTASMQRCVERGAEFFLERELHRQGKRYPPWYRFHDPVYFYYDVLVGLEILTSLGYGRDPRLGFALSLLKKKRRPDGRWNLDAIPPDVGHATSCRRFALENAGAPSKMITLRALRVLDRVDS